MLAEQYNQIKVYFASSRGINQMKKRQSEEREDMRGILKGSFTALLKDAIEDMAQKDHYRITFDSNTLSSTKVESMRYLYKTTLMIFRRIKRNKKIKNNNYYRQKRRKKLRRRYRGGSWILLSWLLACGRNQRKKRHRWRYKRWKNDAKTLYH